MTADGLSAFSCWYSKRIRSSPSIAFMGSPISVDSCSVLRSSLGFSREVFELGNRIISAIAEMALVTASVKVLSP